MIIAKKSGTDCGDQLYILRTLQVEKEKVFERAAARKAAFARGNPVLPADKIGGLYFNRKRTVFPLNKKTKTAVCARIGRRTAIPV